MLARRFYRAPPGSRLLGLTGRQPSRPNPSVRTVTTTTSTSTAPDAAVRPLTSRSNPHAATPSATHILPAREIRHEHRPTVLPTTKEATPAPPPSATGPLPASVAALLPALALQAPHYATVHIHARPYLVTQGDRVRLPFRMPGVQPGDVLRLTQASTLGSRDFTLRGAPLVDSRLFECRAVVAGVEAEPMRVMDKTKRRNRRVKHVRSKHRYTELVVSELKVLAPEELREADT